MWQVSGRSDITDFEEVVELDKEYIENWNISEYFFYFYILYFCISLFLFSFFERLSALHNFENFPFTKHSGCFSHLHVAKKKKSLHSSINEIVISAFWGRTKSWLYIINHIIGISSVIILIFFKKRSIL